MTIHPQIRPAKAEDVPDIYAMVRELAEFEKLAEKVDSTEESLAEALFGESPRVFAVIVEASGGRPIGFAIWFYTFSSFRGRHGVWIEDLYIRPEWRGKGCGKAVMAELAKHCLSENLARLEWSVLDWNREAIDFYEKQGAAVLDDWRICRLDGTALWRLADKTL